MTTAITREIALKFIERAQLLDLRGKRRDEAAVDFFCGAGVALMAAGKETEAKTVALVGQLVVAVQGWGGVRKLAENK